MRRCTRDVSDVIAKEQNSQTLTSCSLDILSSLRSPLQMNQGTTTPQQREKMGVHYVHLQTTTLLEVIFGEDPVLQSSHVGNKPLFMEIMNESIFESLIKEMFDAGEQHTDSTEQGL